MAYPPAMPPYTPTAIEWIHVYLNACHRIDWDPQRQCSLDFTTNFKNTIYVRVSYRAQAPAGAVKGMVQHGHQKAMEAIEVRRLTGIIKVETATQMI
jgi:hypothetical protein